MASGKPFRMAIIGAGGIAGMHARSINDLEHAELAAVCRRSKDKAEAFAAEHGGQAFTDPKRMLDEAKPDVVTVCTPSGVHHEGVTACLEAGVPVLCEKPLEITTERVDALIDTAERTQTPLGGIFMQRFSPVMQTIQEAAASGRFGDLAAVNGYVPWWRDDAYYSPDRWQGKQAYDGGGALMNQAIHIVDMVQWLAGSCMDQIDEHTNPVAEAMAYTGKRGHDPNVLEVEDVASVALRLRNGALGQFFASTAMYPGALRRVQLGGRNGMAETLEEELVTWQFHDADEADEQIRSRFGQASATSGGASDPMAIDYANHRRNIDAFLQALQDGSRFMLNAREARKAVAIIEAVYQSAATGQPVTVS
jgi:predicted dehydrogenase